MPSVSIFGIGRMGGALAIALSRAGYNVEFLIHRDRTTVERIRKDLPAAVISTPSTSVPRLSSDIVLITTADPDIAEAAERIETCIENRPIVLHTSGSLSSDVLANLARIGCPTGSLHPLISISDAFSGSEGFRNIYFCIEGTKPARAAAGEIVRALGGFPFSIGSEKKPLYHAAAVTAAGHITAVVDVAIEMLEECGVDADTAQKVLIPLVKSAVANLETQKPARALTGTFARADVAAFERHLSSMEGVTPDSVRQIYLLLAERSLVLAATNGANPERVQKIRERISIAKRKSE